MSNPYIKSENYYDGYNEKIDALKNNPEIVEMDKLCYEVLEKNEQGKKLLELLEKRFVYPALARPGVQGYSDMVTFYEGVKESIRMLRVSIVSHQSRIDKEGMV